jgi:hypothetical protein
MLLIAEWRSFSSRGFMLGSNLEVSQRGPEPLDHRRNTRGFSQILMNDEPCLAIRRV